MSKVPPKNLKPNEPGPYDLVISRGQAIDPETCLNGIRDIGIKGDRIVAISEEPLEGETVIDAKDKIVAPGFIDLHAHGQQLPAAWVQAFDGVTTALELESGLLPIRMYYDLMAEEGRPINYGASAAWTYARVEVKEGIEPDGTIGWFQKAFELDNWQNTLATEEELEKIIELVEAGLKEGGLGIGINAGYAPGYGRKEYYELAKLAAQYKVPTYTHIRYLSVIEPSSSFEALEELISLAAATGTHMHVCHVNSTSIGDIKACAELLQGAQAAGLPITVEAYPYGAGSSAIGAEIFRGDDWLDRWGVESPSNMELNGEPLDQKTIDELQESEPGTIIVMHYFKPDENPEDRALMDESILYPNAAIASDAMPWVDEFGELLEGDIWPLPDDAYAHPRSAGTYSRFIAQWVREREKISLEEAIRKASLIPAQILEESVPQMKQKGRLQVGVDADIIVFDLGELEDHATYLEPTKLSQGFSHVIVNGKLIIDEGKRIENCLPGQPIRRTV